jgi:hypothetical protein
VRYFGNESDITIAAEIKQIDDACFRFHGIVAVTFPATSQLSSIGAQAFWSCDQLRTIVIPSSVRFLGNHCFGFCGSLETVYFCEGSRLKEIPESAFSFCGSLMSITLPPSVKLIDHGCFTDCLMLENSPIPVDSELARIGAGVFESCWALQSMVLPSTVEFVDEDCFFDCDLLSSLTFGSPSHLRELLSPYRVVWCSRNSKFC